MNHNISAWLIILAALCWSLGEGITLIALGLAVVMVGIDARATMFTPQHRMTSWHWTQKAMVLGLSGWLITGMLGAWQSGFSPRMAHMYNVVLLPVLVLAWELAKPARAQLRKRVLMAFLGGICLATVLGICQWLWGTFPGEAIWLHSKGERYRPQMFIDHTTARAATGLLFNRIKMAFVLLAGWGVWLALTQHIAWPMGKRILPWFGLGLTSLALLGTNVHAVIGGVIVSTALWLIILRWPRWRRHAGTLVWIMVLGSGIAAVIGSSMAPTADAHSMRSDSHIAVRQWIWQHALTVFQHHPWFGSGIGTYHQAATAYRAADAVHLGNAHVLDAHNFLLTILAESGTIGLTCWLIFCAGACGALNRAWQKRHLEEPDRTALLTIATCWLLAFAVIGTVHNPFYHPQSVLVWWWAIGWCWAYGSHDRANTDGGQHIAKATAPK